MKKIVIPMLLFTLFLLGCSNPTSSKDDPTSSEDNPTSSEETRKVTVSYDSQGGSAVSSQQVSLGGTVETLPVSEKFTYTFDGWYTAVNGGGTKFLANTAVNADITVYASWTQTAVVTTLAGSGSSGAINGTGTAASFNEPYGVTADSAGNVYVADYRNHLIRKITSSGVVTTLAGTSGYHGSDDGTGIAATFNFPTGVAVDSGGTVYVTDTLNYLIRKITSSGVVTTLAGKLYTPGSDDGTGAAASFSSPYGVAVDSEGNVYVADSGNHLIRKITPSGVVTTLAGKAGTSGSVDGTGTSASFSFPKGVAVDSAGTVYVADYGNNLIRKITPAGVVTTLAGSSGTSGSTNGTGTEASFSDPSGVAVDSAGNVYVADYTNHLIRKITPSGVVTTLAGSSSPGSSNGTGTAASFRNPTGVAVDSTGTVYVADTKNHLIRKITQ